MGKKAIAAFGEFAKSKRLKLGLTLRQFCRENDYDTGNMSKMERGLLPPPKGRKYLEAYAKALGIEKGREDWRMFFDLAAASSGRIPERIMKDDKLVARLPLVFRAMDGKPLTEKRLRELADLIRQQEG